MRAPKAPRGARHLRAYAEAQSYLAQFVEHRYPFLWIVGRPGVGKTEALKAAVGNRQVYYRKGGQLTPLQFFLDCYEHRGQPVILDDAEHLLDDKIGAKLISALGDTSETKQLCYASTSSRMGDIPQTYHTTSPLCIIANRATAHEAIQSRATTLYFDPTGREIHCAAARWFWDQEIHDWFGRHLFRLAALETRWYVHADLDKRAGRDWRQIILQTRALDKAACIVQDLEGDPAYPTREDKARRFGEVVGSEGGGSRATYFRLRRRLEAAQQLTPATVSPIRVRGRRRTGTPSLLELDSLEAPLPAQPEPDPQPLDLPAHDAFAQPIQGTTPAPAAAPRPIVDDSSGLDRRPPDDEDDEPTP